MPDGSANYIYPIDLNTYKTLDGFFDDKPKENYVEKKDQSSDLSTPNLANFNKITTYEDLSLELNKTISKLYRFYEVQLA